MRILVAEDDNSMRKLVERLLIQASFEPVCVANGREAVVCLEREGFDIVLTDLLMPEMNGFQLIAHLRKQYPSIPIIVMTAANLREIDSEIASGKLFPIIRKPFPPKLLVEIIEEQIRAKETGRLKKIGLGSFLQLLAMERQSTALRVTKGDLSGFLFVYDGQLVDAKTGDKEGEDAARIIVGWNGAEIALLDLLSKRPRRVNSSLTKLLMDAALESDNDARGLNPTHA